MSELETITPKDVNQKALDMLSRADLLIPGKKYSQYYDLLEKYPTIKLLLEFLEGPIIGISNQTLKDLKIKEDLSGINQYLPKENSLNVKKLDSETDKHPLYRSWRKQLINKSPLLEDLLKSNKLKKNRLSVVLIVALTLIEEDKIFSNLNLAIRIRKILIQIDNKIYQESIEKYPDNTEEFNQIKALPTYEQLELSNKLTFVRNVNSVVISILNQLKEIKD